MVRARPSKSLRLTEPPVHATYLSVCDHIGHWPHTPASPRVTSPASHLFIGVRAMKCAANVVGGR